MNPSPIESQRLSSAKNAGLPDRRTKTNPIASPGSPVLEGQILSAATLDAKDVAYLNFAREEHRKLEAILLCQIIPALGGYENELACDIARHLEQIRTFSSNFCWKHRYLGSSHDALKVGGEQ